MPLLRKDVNQLDKKKLPYGDNNVAWYADRLQEAQEHIRLLLDKVVDKDGYYMDYSDGWRSRVKNDSPEQIITDSKSWMRDMGIPYVERW